MNKPKPLPEINAADIARFWRYVQRRKPDECWLWQASVFSGGYGQIKVSGRTVKAHRLAYFIQYGIDPVDGLICHTCDNPLCCNGAHLFIGTAADNSADCIIKGRNNPACGWRHGSKTHPERFARGERVAGSKLNPAKVLEIRKLYTSGLSQYKIADRFGITRENVGKVIRGESWRHVISDGQSISLSSPERRGRKGEHSNQAKLNEQQVLEIRHIYSHFEVSFESLSKKFGVSPATISFIVKRRTWTHI